MKRSLLALFSALLFFGMVGSAGAVPVTWTDTIDFNPDILIPPTYSYWHDISDDGFSSWWTGGNDTISSFTLEVSLYDDNEPDVSSELQIVGWKWWIVPIFDWVTVTNPDGTEGAYVNFGLVPHEFSFENGSETYTGNLFGELDLWHDGTLNVSVSADFGDFYLASSILTVNGDDGTAPVPEPTTILLLGSGLLGLAGFNRKRFNKKS